VQQVEFCRLVQNLHPHFFSNRLVLDIGSLDINGNNSIFFKNCLYLGIDLMLGKNVDFTSKGHELMFPDACADVIISTECFEHDMFYEKTLKNIVRLLKPGGLFFFTCATTGRHEHGTRRTTPSKAPLLEHFAEWADYYKNLEEADIRKVLNIEDIFSEHQFSVGTVSCDLYFWGIKKGEFKQHEGYSFLVNKNQHVELKNELLKEKQKNEELASALMKANSHIDMLKNTIFWRLTKQLKKIRSKLVKPVG